MSAIDIKMRAIYHASHDVLPSRASGFSAEAEKLDSIRTIVTELAKAGNPPLGPDLGDLAVEIFIFMRKMVRTLNDSATALDRIADDFVTVNTDAAAWMRQHKQYLGDPDTAAVPIAPKV